MSLKRLLGTVLWDLRLQVKYQILTVAVIVTILYVVIFKLLVRDEFDEILVLLIFTDPAMLGFAGASRIRNFNQYIIIIPIFLTPLALPLLNFFQLTDTWLLYILPTQATLNLLWASFHTISPINMVYSLVCLPVWLLLSYLYAAYSFRKYIMVSSEI